MFITVLLAFIEYGLLRIFGIKIEKDYFRVLNDNIVDGHLIPNLPTETIKKIFYSLAKEPTRSSTVGYKYGILIVFSTLLIEWLASGGQTTNLLVILTSGLISYFLVVIFGSSLAERSIYPMIKQCRTILIKRGEKFEEPKLTNFKKKFNYFLLIPLLLVVSILNFIPSISLNIIIFSLLGFIMIVVVNNVLFSSLYTAFSELENFAKELPKSRKTNFSTGSLTKEIVGLSINLNKAANEIYFSQKEIEEKNKKLKNSYQEIKKRKDELEGFYRLTVDRELKMIELKKDIKELKKRKNNI